jgi:glucokinase
VADVIAVDVGGTKLAAGLVREDGTLAARAQVPTRRDLDADALFATLTQLVDEIGARDAIAVGVGCGGPMDAGGEHVSPINIPAWRAFPLRARLAAHTGLRVFLDNDAKALALAEGWRGAATGEPD